MRALILISILFGFNSLAAPGVDIDPTKPLDGEAEMDFATLERVVSSLEIRLAGDDARGILGVVPSRPPENPTACSVKFLRREMRSEISTNRLLVHEFDMHGKYSSVFAFRSASGYRVVTSTLTEESNTGLKYRDLETIIRTTPDDKNVVSVTINEGTETFRKLLGGTLSNPTSPVLKLESRTRRGTTCNLLR